MPAPMITKSIISSCNGNIDANSWRPPLVFCRPAPVFLEQLFVSLANSSNYIITGHSSRVIGLLGFARHQQALDVVPAR